MTKQKHSVRVDEAGFFTREQIRQMPLEEKQRLGLILSGGGQNDYRYYKFIGQGGSSREESWNREAHQHDCCGSHVCWRHKTSCPRLQDI